MLNYNSSYVKCARSWQFPEGSTWAVLYLPKVLRKFYKQSICGVLCIHTTGVNELYTDDDCISYILRKPLKFLKYFFPSPIPCHISLQKLSLLKEIVTSCTWGKPWEWQLIVLPNNCCTIRMKYLWRISECDKLLQQWISLLKLVVAMAAMKQGNLRKRYSSALTELQNFIGNEKCFNQYKFILFYHLYPMMKHV